MTSLDDLRERLVERLRELESCAVAFSGGVDSAVVAQAAHLALGARAVAVTGVSESLAAGELDEARELARQIGIRHVVLQTHEFERPEYVQNSFDRCYHCKTELYSSLESRLPELGVHWIVTGTNRDDLGDFRPGLRAASEHRVISPLADCQFTKSDVRALAAHWGLPVWDKPATPCLSSRVAYGEQVTRERLEMIDRAERYLRSEGFPVVRVRYHRGDLARVEVPVEELERLLAPLTRQRLKQRLQQLGFKFVTIDLEGFQSGSLNRLVSLTAAPAHEQHPT